MGIGSACAQTDSISIAEVEVTAVAKTSALKSSVPVQSLSSGRMSQLGIGSMVEALRHMAGITVRDYGGAGGMKTVSVRGMGARHTGVIYDGMAISDCQTGEIDLSRFDTENTADMTLAIGDADNIFVPARNTSTPAALYIETVPDSAFSKARLATGSWGTLNPSFKVCLPIEKVMLDMSASYLHSDNDYPFTLKNVSLTTREHRQNSRMDAGRMELGMRLQMSNTTSMSAKGYYYDNDRQLPGIVHLYTQDNDEQLHERNAFIQSSLRSTLSSTVSVQANAKVSWASSMYKKEKTSIGITSQSYWQREYYGSTAVLYAPCHNLSFDYSADYAHNNLNSTLATLNSPSRNTIWQSLSMKYSSHRVNATSRMLWTNCWDNNSKAHSHKDKVNASASVSYAVIPKDKLYVRASWKSAFRMPTFNELYFYHLGSTDLKPETTRQWNLGLTSSNEITIHHGKININATVDGYMADVDYKIVAIPFNMFVWRMMNLAKVRTYGIDATANIACAMSPQHTITLAANYTLQKAQNRSNPQSKNYKKQIAYTPEHTFATTLTWENPWTDIAITIDGMDERWTTNEHTQSTRIAGFAEMDINLSRRFHIGKTMMKAIASMLNVTDRQYDIVAHYPMPGRSWRIGIEVSPIILKKKTIK